MKLIQKLLLIRLTKEKITYRDNNIVLSNVK